MANKLKKILAAFLSAATVMCSAPSASAFFFAVEEEIVEEEVVEEVVEEVPAPIAPEIDDGGTTYYFYDILFLETPKYSKDPDLSADKVKGDSITLSWNKYKEASYVRLYRYLPSKKKYYRLAELKTGSQGFDFCTYTDDGLQGGTSYNYKIKFFSSHGNYQNDIYKIDGSRPVWQIMEKQEGQCASWAFCLDAMLEYVGFDIRVVRGTRPSGQHFWCQIAANGKYYDLDAHLGDFMVEHKGSYRDYVIVETF